MAEKWQKCNKILLTFNFNTSSLGYNSPMKKEIKRALIVRLSALGDIVNSAIVVQFIKECYPHISLEWVCEESFAPLLECCDGLDRVHTINLKEIKQTKSLSSLKATIQKLRSLGEFDTIIDMQGLLKSAIVARLVGSGVHGFDKESTRESLSAFFYKTSSSIGYEESVIKRNITLINDSLLCTISEEMVVAKRAIFKKHHEFTFEQKNKNIAFVIGASWVSKIYPKELVIEVCKELGSSSIHLIWGNQEEFEAAMFIAQASPNATLAPKLSLSELVAFVSQMDLLIGNDTGPSHLAWAQNISSIILFGPTTQRMMQLTAHNRAIKSPSAVDIFKINKNDLSIKEISPKNVANAAKELLDGI